MKLKICGLKYSDNIKQIAELNVDMLGFIFYEKSFRFVNNELDEALLDSLPKHLKKISVFADQSIEHILAVQQKYKFDLIQLHGNETPEYCRALSNYGLEIVKAFSVDELFDFSQTKLYQPFCKLFLFDTKGKEKGGNGFAFNWELLENYSLSTPFLLSGGIGEDNIKQALIINHKKLVGFDINSRVETAPALKSVEQVKNIIDLVKNKRL